MKSPTDIAHIASPVIGRKNAEQIDKKDVEQGKANLAISFEQALACAGGSNMPSKMAKSKTDNRGKGSLTVHAPETVHTFASSLDCHTRPSSLSNGLAATLASSKRPCQDFYYREVLITRYIRFGAAKRIGASERVDVEAVDEVCPRLPPVPLEPDAKVAAANIRKALRIRSALLSPLEDTSDILSSLPNRFGSDATKKRLLTRILAVIRAQQTVEYVAEGVDEPLSVRHVSLQRNAIELRKAFSLTTSDLKIGVWAHGILLQNLCVKLLAIYLQLLRYLKQIAHALVELLTSHSNKQEGDTDGAIKDANQLVRRLIFHKVSDPLAAFASKTPSKKLKGNIHLVLVPPTLSNHARIKLRAHEHFYKFLFPLVGQVHQVSFEQPHLNCTVAGSSEFMIDNIRDKIIEVKKATRGDASLILVGWGSSCLLNCKVAQDIAGISAIVNMAFPTISAYGARGETDDDIVTVTVPSIFVVGQSASDNQIDCLQDLRDYMQCESGLIVVGGANASLQICASKLLLHYLTQKTLNRALLDYIVEYLERVLHRPMVQPVIFAPSAAKMNSEPMSVNRKNSQQSRNWHKRRADLLSSEIATADEKRMERQLTPEIVQIMSNELDNQVKRRRDRDETENTVKKGHLGQGMIEKKWSRRNTHETETLSEERNKWAATDLEKEWPFDEESEMQSNRF